MIEINLLPGGAARRPAGGGKSLALPSMPKLGGGNPVLAGAGAAAVLVTLGGAYLFWSSGARVTELEAQVAQEVADSTRLAGTIALVGQLEARQDTIEQKIDVIRGVDERRYVWPHLMDEISRSLPPYTWLTKLTANEEEAPPPPPKPAPGDTAAAAKAKADSAAAAAAVPVGPSFNLEGNTGNTQALTRFMKNLESSPLIRDVQLVTSEQTQTEGRVYTKFTLEARFEQPDTTIIETVPVISIR